MTADRPVTDQKQGFFEGCLMGNLVPGPRKSGIFAQFMERINQRDTPSPSIALMAPTGKAHAHPQTSHLSEGAEVQNPNEELETGIPKPKF